MREDRQMDRDHSDSADDPKLPYKFTQLTPMSEWRHVKTGSTYIVIGVARDSTNGEREGEVGVVYWSKTYAGLRYRKASEFLDGRFIPLDAMGKPS